MTTSEMICSIHEEYRRIVELNHASSLALEESLKMLQTMSGYQPAQRLVDQTFINFE